MEGRREDQAVAAEYRARLALRTSDVARLEQRHALLASLRLGMFFLAALLIALLGRTSAPWLAIPVVAFIPLLFAHARVLNQRDRAARAAAFYERGLARIEERWQGRGERGERFRDPSHLYAEDLDLFGAGGLFELLATTRTSGGEDVLAAWLLSPAPPTTIRQRQQSLAELAPRVDFREDVAVIGPDVEGVVRSDDLRKWAAAPPQLSGTWPRIVLPLLAAISTGLVIQWIWSTRPPDLLLPALVAQGLLAYRFRHGVHHVTHGLEQREQELRVLATLMERIEREPLESEGLRAIRDRLRATGRAPADEIRRLARLVEMLSSGHNQIFAPISALLLLGTQLAFAVEHWRRRCGPAVSQWLGAVAECEALTALATYTAEHPHDPFPEMVEGSPSYIGEAIAHPLLPAAIAVANDVRMGATDAHLLMVSGSNMSGKSTLLRTIGLNAVLAQAGGPVRARRLVMTPFRIGATLRIQDSLQAGRSRFFAEITRISEIVALQPPASEVHPSVLFLLDELLMGTNSHDRLLGATGILRGLIERGAIGLATTHDLALTRIVDSLAGRAANVHFEDGFENGVLTFDYRLRPGVVRSSNALALMRAVGLDV